MDLIEAVTKMNKLEEDISKIDHWIADITFGEKEQRLPISGKYAYKIKRAIESVITEMGEENQILEKKIKEAINNIEIS